MPAAASYLYYRYLRLPGARAKAASYPAVAAALAAAAAKAAAAAAAAAVALPAGSSTGNSSSSSGGGTRLVTPPPRSPAMFPWESAFTGAAGKGELPHSLTCTCLPPLASPAPAPAPAAGEEACPSWAPTGAHEIHVSGDIAASVWAHWQAHRAPLPRGTACVPRESSWLGRVGWPLLQGIADFWLARAVTDTAGARVPGFNAPLELLPSPPPPPPLLVLLGGPGNIHC